MKKSYKIIGIGLLLVFILPRLFYLTLPSSFYYLVGYLPLAGYLLIVYAVFLWYKDYKEYRGGKNWLKDVDTIDYKHQYKRDGIAVDKQNRKLYLKSGTNEKSYSFSDVREWSTNIASGGMSRSRGSANIGDVGAAVGENIGENMRAKKENKRRTGLYINVKDVDNPKWKISFKYNGKKSSDELEQQLARWMEILNQSINEN